MNTIRFEILYRSRESIKDSDVWHGGKLSHHLLRDGFEERAMVFSLDTEKRSENNKLNIRSLRGECCNSQNKFGDSRAPTMNSFVIDDVL